MVTNSGQSLRTAKDSPGRSMSAGDAIFRFPKSLDLMTKDATARFITVASALPSATASKASFGEATIWGAIAGNSRITVVMTA